MSQCITSIHILKKHSFNGIIFVSFTFYTERYDFKVGLNLSKNDVQNHNILSLKKETKHLHNKYIIFLRSLIHINTDGIVPSGNKSDVPR